MANGEWNPTRPSAALGPPSPKPGRDSQPLRIPPRFRGGWREAPGGAPLFAIRVLHSRVALKQRSPEDQEGDTEIDDEAAHIDERRDKGCRGACRVEADPLEGEGQHRAGERAESDDRGQRNA